MAHTPVLLSTLLAELQGLLVDAGDWPVYVIAPETGQPLVPGPIQVARGWRRRGGDVYPGIAECYGLPVAPACDEEPT